MPYITPDQREALKTRPPLNAGELNYAMATSAADYVRAKGLSYQTIAEVIAAFEGAKAEFYRCVAAPYEQGKREENGEIWSI